RHAAHRPDATLNLAIFIKAPPEVAYRLVSTKIGTAVFPIIQLHSAAKCPKNAPRIKTDK
ncbi:hypothetical protein K5M56_33140, partial [Serratia marcescens]|nr:hypothetical protein [Serratia marcescens]